MSLTKTKAKTVYWTGTVSASRHFGNHSKSSTHPHTLTHTNACPFHCFSAFCFFHLKPIQSVWQENSSFPGWNVHRVSLCLMVYTPWCWSESTFCKDLLCKNLPARSNVIIAHGFFLFLCLFLSNSQRFPLTYHVPVTPLSAVHPQSKTMRSTLSLDPFYRGGNWVQCWSEVSVMLQRPHSPSWHGVASASAGNHGLHQQMLRGQASFPPTCFTPRPFIFRFSPISLRFLFLSPAPFFLFSFLS